MKIEEYVKRRIIKNAALSVFIYTLPVILMVITFHFTGARPWKNKAHTAKTINQPTTKTLN